MQLLTQTQQQQQQQEHLQQNPQIYVVLKDTTTHLNIQQWSTNKKHALL